MYDLDNPPFFDPICESKGEAEQQYDSDAQCSLCANIYTVPYFDARPHGKHIHMRMRPRIHFIRI